jgi:hypothetical protein
VELFVAVLDTEEDLDCVGFVGRRNFHSLEAALEGAVFFDRLAIFAGRGGADALNLAAGQCGFENVGGIERAFGGASADQRVKFVNEDDGILRFHQLFHDGLQPLFELAAVLRARDDE